MKATRVTEGATVAWLEALTTPDSEDWTVIPDRDEVHFMALREIAHSPKPRVVARYYAAPLAEFRRSVEGLASDHPLGCVMVIVCCDFEDSKTDELLAWLLSQAKAKGFSLTSMCGSATTKEAIQSMQSGFIE